MELDKIVWAVAFVNDMMSQRNTGLVVTQLGAAQEADRVLEDYYRALESARNEEIDLHPLLLGWVRDLRKSEETVEGKVDIPF